MSHRVVVSDSSVLIDLERGSFFVAAFALRLEFCVPDLLYRRELEPYGGDRLRGMGLRILELDDIGVSLAVRYRQAVAALSLSDAFALALAHRTGSTLLTGDARLQRLASDKKGRLPRRPLAPRPNASRAHATPHQLYDGLVRIRDHTRCRLPKAEVNRRRQTFKRAGRGL